VATWNSNGQDTGGSGGYVSGTQGVQYIHDTFAANGDTITLPTGTFTWNTGVTLTKTITVSGSGYLPNLSTLRSSPGAPTLATTISTSTPSLTYAVKITLPTGSGFIFRMTGIYFQNINSSSYNYLIVSGSPSTDQFRIDNNFFDGGTVQVVMIGIGGNPSGVMDHCTLQGGAASEMIHNTSVGAGNISGWTDDITPGGSKMFFIEDCIGQLTNYSSAIFEQGTSLMQSYYGARNVVRYTQLNFAQIDQHGTGGAVGARWFEFYNNNEFFPTGVTGATSFYAIRGGSGVIYSNSVSGTLTYAFVVSLYTDDTSGNTTYGTAPNFGPGAGIFKNSLSQGPFSSPVYLWNNDSHISIGTQVGTGGWNPSPILLNQNYYTSTTQPSSMLICERSTDTVGVTTYSYSPYTYPHPLTGLSTSPGFGLTATSDLSLTKTIVGVTSGAYTTPSNNYLACFSTQFTNGAKAGATEWATSSNPSYARVAMGATGTGWTIAAYASGVGVVWNNTNTLLVPAVQSNNQTLYAIAFCDSATIGAGNIDFFIDMPNSGQLTVLVGLNVVLPAGTGAVFTTL